MRVALLILLLLTTGFDIVQATSCDSLQSSWKIETKSLEIKSRLAKRGVDTILVFHYFANGKSRLYNCAYIVYAENGKYYRYRLLQQNPRKITCKKEPAPNSNSLTYFFDNFEKFENELAKGSDSLVYICPHCPGSYYNLTYGQNSYCFTLRPGEPVNSDTYNVKLIKLFTEQMK